MEDSIKDSDKTPSPASGDTGGVMDVQPPKTQPVSGVPPVSTPTSPVNTPEPVAFEPPQQPATSVSPPNQGIIAPPENKPTNPVESASPDQKTPPVDHLLTAHAEHKRKPVMAIVGAILIAAGLIGVAVFAYMQTNKKMNESQVPVEHQQQSSTEAATTEDVDHASQGVDDTLGGAEEAAEFPESELSDQTLGL